MNNQSPRPGEKPTAATTSTTNDPDIKARPKRRRNRASEDRGLPPDEELERFAHTYLTMARERWPMLAEAGVLPESTPAVIAEMVADFKHRHRGGKIDKSRINPLVKRGFKLAAMYPRYSCDRSQPTSIIDQARNELTKAKQEGCFVPWCYTFADYSVSGLDDARQGYNSLKAVIRSEHHPINVVYIDEFSRASRNEIEWLKLAALCKKLSVRLVGASDGFNIDSEDWDIRLGFYNLINKAESKYRRSRSHRGMQGAAEDNRALGKLPLGYTRRVNRDAQGNIECKIDGSPHHERCIDPATKDAVREAFELVKFKGWSPYAVARRFNQKKVDGWDGWSPQGIRDLLINPAFIGLFIWGRTRREYDPDTDKVEIKPTKWTEWGIHYDPSLALVPKSWHVAMRRRFEKNSQPGTAAPRSKMASTLFDGTLVCGYCGHELRLYRSQHKYKVMHCPNGVRSAYGCQLRASKSVSIIEDGILGHIRGHLFTEQVLGALVEKANAHLAEEAARPQEDLAPLKAEIRQREATSKRLVALTEAALQANADDADKDAESDDGDGNGDGEVEGQELLQDYFNRVKQLRREVHDRKKQLREKEKHNADPPPPLDPARVGQYVQDLREVLNQDIPASAEALRTLTGPITIHQEKDPARKRGAVWIATFSPNLMRLLAHVGRQKRYPESITLGHLSDAIWTTAEPVTLRLDQARVIDRIGEAVVQQIKGGASATEVARAHGVHPGSVDRAWRCQVHGIRQSAHDPALAAFNPPRQRPKGAADVMDQVAELRHDHGLDFVAIGRRLGVSSKLAGQAHRLWHERHPDGPEDIPWPVICGRTGMLSPAQRRRVCELARAGYRQCQIVQETGHAKAQVHKVLESLRRM